MAPLQRGDCPDNKAVVLLTASLIIASNDETTRGSDIIRITGSYPKRWELSRSRVSHCMA
ncbi:hypothetical protein CXP54_16525 [Escherichia albertii]|uniref:Uncharacterized protein n=1 Tax=Escherichia albertii TaxID=208962 RepID=A0A7Z8DXL4_ESCAL|nr:hypothetical protein CXP54_16525 [Escherichia albertii]EAB1451976.1 hypothetical protein [Escherichia albertii]EEW0112031.1 hypothetical protein [Escherichia albertii]EEW3327309.1 hypothetical protein [Escherichia albertii]EEW7339080.1 hypothetical protein [Escherichia albertii]